MIAAEPVAAGSSRKRIAGGKTSRNAHSATGSPGVAASFPHPLFGAGRAAGVPQQLRIRDRKIANRQLASTHAALFGALPVEAVIAPLRGDKQREQEPTNDAVPVAGRDRILVCGPPKTHPPACDSHFVRLD